MCPCVRVCVSVCVYRSHLKDGEYIFFFNELCVIYTISWSGAWCYNPWSLTNTPHNRARLTLRKEVLLLLLLLLLTMRLLLLVIIWSRQGPKPARIDKFCFNSLPARYSSSSSSNNSSRSRTYWSGVKNLSEQLDVCLASFPACAEVR